MNHYMSKYFGLLAILFATIVVVQGCTTKRDGRAYRIYHNTTARYNGFYYANLAIVEAENKIKDLHEPNWDEVLPIFLDTDESSSQQVYPLMERAIEKCSKVVDRHTMNPSKRDRKSMKWPEMNKWIDENYTVIGRSYYMKEDFAKAEEIFLFLARTVDTPDAQAWSYSWLGRIYLRTNDLIKANNMLAKAVQYDDASQEAKVHIGLVYAQYYIQKERYEDAVRQLEEAIKEVKKKKDKARPLFILAQCLREMGDSESAIETFKMVVDIRTPYELEFQSKIQQAMTYERREGNSDPIIELLEDMLDEDKNTEYFDQVYYALAEVALEDRKRDEGIENLETSIYVSEGNSRQLGKGYLRLADLHMEDLHYETAQAYYDSALVHMPDDNERKDDVTNLASNLTDLVMNLRTIEEQDSLQELCDLSDDERRRVIENVWEDMVDDLERQKEERDAANEAAISAAGSQGVGMFWPYNGSLRVSGQQNFYDYWGDRALEDHWRRESKVGVAFSNEDETEDSENEEVKDPFDPSSLPTVDEMLSSLPCDPDQRANSLALLAEAYYMAGLDYREKLSDPENAIQTWENLLDRLDSSAFHPTSTYQLFRTYLQREIDENFTNPFCESCNSEYWANQITTNYPGSEWARLIEDPDFLDEEEEAYEFERITYEEHLSSYYARDYQATLLDIDVVINERPENPLRCKYNLLRAQCVGGLTSYTGDRTPYFDALKGILDVCPETEEAAFAISLLRQLGVDLGSVGEIPKEEEEDLTPFIFNPNKEHYFAILIPVDKGNGSEVKAQSSDFNNTFFESRNLRITSNLLSRTHQIVLVKSFSNLSKGMDYHTVFTGNREMLIGLNSSGYDMFIISSENYIELFKNKDLEGYGDFFNTHYLSTKSKQEP
jgi:tetratricopeptide (TPR) repeat protein